MKQRKHYLVLILVVAIAFFTCFGITISPFCQDTTNAAGTIVPRVEPASFNIQATPVSNSSDESNGIHNIPNIRHEFSDPYFDKQWALQKILSLPLKPTHTKTLVAILDTGIDINHEDLVSKIINSVDFSDSGTVIDRNGHGTHIAGIIAAAANNGKGIASTGSAQNLLNVKVADDNGMIWPSNIAKGIIWSTDQGALVINASLCVPSNSPSLQKAVEYAWNKGAIVIASAGNRASSTLSYPAAYKNVVSVGALDIHNAMWEQSNFGEWIQIFGPGIDIYSTLPGNQYGYMSGTSMATAYVSSIAAEYFSQTQDQNNDGQVNDEVADLLKELFAQLR